MSEEAVNQKSNRGVDLFPRSDKYRENYDRIFNKNCSHESQDLKDDLIENGKEFHVKT